MNISKYISRILGNSLFLEEVVIVGPYPSPLFFSQLLGQKLRRRTPKTGPAFTIVVDDGWDPEEIEKIRNAIPSGPGIRQPKPIIRRVSTNSGRGLVHAKIYYFEAQNKARTYTKQYLLLGSANASIFGFGIHSETFITVDLGDLEADARRIVGAYLIELRAGTKTNGAEFCMGRGTWISLPSFRFVDEKVGNFDAWLRQGRLCHKYLPDQNFGKLSLRLKKPLPKSDIESALTGNGFRQDQDASQFNRRYLDEITVEDDEHAQWPKLFVETYYGLWTSSQCFSEKEEEFKASNADARESELLKIKAGVDKERWLMDFRSALTAMVKKIPLDKRPDYMDLDDVGLPVNQYLERAKAKLNADFQKAANEDFSRRYVKGYEFPRVPPLSDDFEKFALDFCATIISKLGGQRVANKLALAIREAFGDDLPDNAADLLSECRKRWKKREFRNNLLAYHKSES